MTKETYDLNFDGYWLEPGGLPAESGIYGVYACTSYKGAEPTPDRLIYIGESYDVRDRVTKHEMRREWEEKLELLEMLCFNATLISSAEDRERVEAAMIYKHKPVCNDKYRHSFDFDTTEVGTSGMSGCMEESFTVYRT